MAHNPAHDLFSIGNFLCRVRVVDCCDLRNGAERQWFIVAMISGNFFFLKSFLAGTTTVMHRYGPNDTYPCVFNMKRTTYPYLLADFYDASQFEMKNFVNLNIQHYNSDPVISLFGNMQIMFQYMEYDVTCINKTFASHISATKINLWMTILALHFCTQQTVTLNDTNPSKYLSRFGLQPVTKYTPPTPLSHSSLLGAARTLCIQNQPLFQIFSPLPPLDPHLTLPLTLSAPS